MDGVREVLGMWVGENESAKFWLSILNGLKNRGVEDILIACVDGLTGFSNAIEAIFPRTEIQQCVIHQIRNSTKFVSYKDIKLLMTDLKKVYAAIDEQTALYELEVFDEKWGVKYPKIALSWRSNWANLSTYFKYPQEVRTLIYTTNAIENFNRQLRKVTKSKSVEYGGEVLHPGAAGLDSWGGEIGHLRRRRDMTVPPQAHIWCQFFSEMPLRLRMESSLPMTIL
jgi:putative transposase